MNEKLRQLVQKLCEQHSLTTDEYEYLVREYTPHTAEVLREKAVELRRGVYGEDVYIRGLIEISNYCKNDCYYCGIRRSNRKCDRYRLTKEDILLCCEEGYKLGFRTFVLQGGEDMHFSDIVLCDIVSSIKARYPDCAVTLSMGERSRESYEKLYKAGADRYLLRHETADADHYSKLHPEELTLENRLECLENLRDIGYQVGCGFMVGSPYQTPRHIACDLKFIEKFKPDMCGVGPFIPHKDTPFGEFPAGDLELVCMLLSVIRIIHPSVLLPSTTALGSIHPTGREQGILSGANVVMPNLSPENVRKKYMLYNGKASDGAEAAQCKEELEKRIASVGYRVVTHRGDIKKTD